MWPKAWTDAGFEFKGTWITRVHVDIRVYNIYSSSKCQKGPSQGPELGPEKSKRYPTWWYIFFLKTHTSLKGLGRGLFCGHSCGFHVCLLYVISVSWTLSLYGFREIIVSVSSTQILHVCIYTCKYLRSIIKVSQVIRFYVCPDRIIWYLSLLSGLMCRKWI